VFQDADATLNASSPAVGSAKRAAVSLLTLAGVEWSLSWQGDGADTEVMCKLLVVQREEGAIGSQQCGNVLEALLMMGQARRELGCIRRIAGDDRIAGNHSTVHFVTPSASNVLSVG